MTAILTRVFVLWLLVVVFSPNSTQSQTAREEWQPPEEIMDAIGVKPGMVIGEPGAGSGYMTLYLARRVGKEGKIYANDISRSALDELESRAAEEGVKNIEIVLGEVKDPVFPVKELDMVIMVYVLHMLDKPVEFMKNVRKYMTPETPLVIIERNTHKDRGHPPSFMSIRQILDTLQKSDYVLERTETSLPMDTTYILKQKSAAPADD